VSFAKTGDPNGAGRPEWKRHVFGEDGVMLFRNDGTAAFVPDPVKPRVDAVQASRDATH
jgi:para-nitrobenzyl esterase